MARHNYYIIESNRPYFIALDMSKDAGYAELLQLEKERKLKSEHPTVVPRSMSKTNP